ncbi:BCCT family transporter [Rhodospira trueperi]|uniref:Choline/glycine/proline betaine transport protein n=1 Tax=Rhodospira trueperi TaxID=69960 RepID=A0A1G7CSQ6_9PROT|nr:choline BCCT transporter BetT [Rhodospira trueperi]SDE41780.1 choline/glycine/proline betaine transport protein [Rhodospira trueperi]
MRIPATINPPVFFGSAGLTLAFVVFGVAFPETANATFSAVQTWIVETFGWFYMLSVAVFVVFALGLALSDHGQVRLGPDDSRPDYSYGSWFAMLFSAGMGIGLMFFGVAEPMMHFMSPPTGIGGDMAAAREAMKITFFHWGIHAWAIYAVIGLALAYYAFRHDLPLTIRSALHPLIGERIHGPIGHAADIFAVLGTMFGVATSLGLGVLQVNAGLAHLFDVPETTTVQLLLIAAITLMATASVVAGLDAGIKRLSNLNLFLALALLVFVLLAGPTLFLLKVTVQNTGAYLSEVVSKTFTLYAYEPNEWIGGWTLFYWAWWIAWSPFVGMFIARVSRGRTIREFVVGVLLVPVGFTFIWLSFFGNGAISLDQGAAGGAIAAAVADNVPLALFTFLEQLPFAEISSVLATVLVVTFFVTSSDSGSLVIDIITSGGASRTPVWQRTMWALSEGLVAAALLLAGGLTALQTASITAALPFAFIMLLVCFALLKSLRIEAARRESLTLSSSVQVSGADVDWRRWLANIVHQPRRGRIEAFLHNTVLGAMQDVAQEVSKLGQLEADARLEGREATLTIHHGVERAFLYAVKPRAFDASEEYAFSQGLAEVNDEHDDQYYRAEVFLSEGSQNYNVFGYTREQIIGDILSQYQKHVQFLHLTR